MAYNLRQTQTGGVGFIDEASSQTGAVVQSMFWDVTRAPTNTVVIGSLPANARIVRIDVQVPIVSNAVTTATVSVGLSGGSATFFSTAQDVKAAIGNFSQAATANWVVSTSAQSVTCTYTETGGASSAGKFAVSLYYVVV
jgi:hypothetical protein